MDDEEKLLGMMAIIEEQQKAIKHLAESTAGNNEHLQQQLTQQQNHLFKKHGEVINQYDDLFKKHLAELNDRGEQWLNWRKLALTVTVTTTCCLVVVAGFSFYLHYLTGWIAEAKINIAELKTFNPQMTYCPHEGENKLCIRIKESWGRYTVNSDPYYIIDSKKPVGH